MEPFVDHSSVVRRIWGKSDTILFIFAGAAAEFALNKAVDWLYYTGRLPADPIGRLFSTVSYARAIVFSSKEDATKALNKIKAIHTAVENSRGYRIPDWAYRDVLFMLIHYSISAYELLERKLSEAEKQEVYDVFYRVGTGMGLKELPPDHRSWLPVREQHMRDDLQRTGYTDDLFKQYKKHLGDTRYVILVEAQKLVIPDHVRDLLGMSKLSALAPAVPFYKLSRLIRLDGFIKKILLPSAYQEQIKALDKMEKISGA